MGCINSTKTGLRNDVFRVRVIRLYPATANLATGYLELNCRELIFITSSGPRVTWSLQHLRRYGLNGDVFSFEAGRRCMTGPGIYTFKCQHSEQLYVLFQQYVNEVSTVNNGASVLVNQESIQSTYPRIPRSLVEANDHANNYLYPVPSVQNSSNNILNSDFNHRNINSQNISLLNEAASMASVSSDLQSQPTTPHSLNINTVIYENSHFHNDEYINRIRLNERNNNNDSPSLKRSECDNESASSTLNHKIIAKGPSLDIPPEEVAPMISPDGCEKSFIDSITSPDKNSFNEDDILTSTTIDSTAGERSYENIHRDDISTFIPSKPTALLCDSSAHPLAPPNTVNYIILDLDNQSSPSEYSRSKGCSSFSLFDSAHISESDALSQDLLASLSETPTTPTIGTCPLVEAVVRPTHLDGNTSCSMGYSTIDFIKTCALTKECQNRNDKEKDKELANQL